MSDAISAQGTTFGVANVGSPAIFSFISEVRNIPGPAETSDEIDVTHLMSLNGYREFIQGFKNTEDLSIEMNHVPSDASQAQLRSDFQAGTVRIYQITWPDSHTATFNAYVKGVTSTANVGDAVPFNVTLRIAGAVTYA